MKRKIFVSDITMKLKDGSPETALSFRQKIELSKLLDKLGVSVIEMGPVMSVKRDSLLVKSLASAIKDSVLAIPIDIFNPESIALTWKSLHEATHARLQVCVPVSTVQMEYLCHKKPTAIVQMTADLVARCRELCGDVEFIAEDFGRSEQCVLSDVVKAAVEQGASLVTMHDTAGTLFDYEMFELTRRMREDLPQQVKLGVWCSNEIFMADSCALAAVRAGADEIKTASCGNLTTSLKRFAKVLGVKSDECMAYSDVKTIELNRVTEQIRLLCEDNRKKKSAVVEELSSDGSEWQLSAHDDKESVLKMVRKLGYELSEADSEKVYEAFVGHASKNEVIGVKELDAIVATAAFQAPATYRLDNYLINAGNIIKATCHLCLKKDDTILENVCIGDGPVDAAFHAIEQLVGLRNELDDFQIQSITEGREAMGGAVVRLRHEGKLFSGRGISTDIVEASIMAYLNAINKIVYEEEEA
ncbi:MAG: alpha-isopropylmalate synthase regulatory domain-containing protein [Bacteroidales bacterium]|nr:alpha-isopropylmalate synthase regulatory domain-containing protein [Bacteroidales bacterium]